MHRKKGSSGTDAVLLITHL